MMATKPSAPKRRKMWITEMVESTDAHTTVGDNKHGLGRRSHHRRNHRSRLLRMWKTEMVEFSDTQSPQNPRLETELRKNHI